MSPSCLLLAAFLCCSSAAILGSATSVVATPSSSSSFGGGGVLTLSWQATFSFEVGFSGRQAPIIAGPSQELIISTLQTATGGIEFIATNRATGATVWTHTISMMMPFEPLISVSDNYLFVVLGQKTYCLSLQDGTQKWSAAVGGTVPATYISNTSTVIVYTDDHMRSIDVATGVITWTVAGTFGECMYFPKPMYNGNGIYVVCGREPFSGRIGISGYSVATGTLMYFKQHDNPNPFYVSKDILVYLDLNNAALQEDVAHAVTSEEGMDIWTFHPNHQHTTGAVVGNKTLIGTWTETFALDLDTGAYLWNTSNPIGPATLSYPLPCGQSAGASLFHVQLEMNFKQAMRRVQLSSGRVQWSSNVDIHSNGLLQHHYAPPPPGSSDESLAVIAMRGKNTIRVWNWGNGTLMGTKSIRESYLTVFAGDHVYIGHSEGNVLYAYRLK